MLKVCLHCGQTFEGRSNATFCSTTCKNAYHNAKRVNPDNVAGSPNDLGETGNETDTTTANEPRKKAPTLESLNQLGNLGNLLGNFGNLSAQLGKFEENVSRQIGSVLNRVGMVENKVNGVSDKVDGVADKVDEVTDNVDELKDIANDSASAIEELGENQGNQFDSLADKVELMDFKTGNSFANLNQQMDEVSTYIEEQNTAPESEEPTEEDEPTEELNEEGEDSEETTEDYGNEYQERERDYTGGAFSYDTEKADTETENNSGWGWLVLLGGGLLLFNALKKN